LAVGFVNDELSSGCALLYTYKLAFMFSLELEALESATSLESNNFDLTSKVIEITMGIFFIFSQQLTIRRLVSLMLQGAYKVREEFLKKRGTHL
jgi:hypothetical protein